MSEKSYRDAIREAMMEEMDRDENVLIMGEDIGVYEGTFRITAGMLKKYGARRVIDTPIAEAGMVGTAVGMAMVGLRPIVEMMTVNFAIVAADQILNHAAKVRYFSGGQVDVPMVIRGPQGAGVQLSAQHSQSFESFYAHFPGIHVVAPATPADAKGLLKTAIRGRDPVMFLESAALYGMKGEVPDDPDFTVPFGESRVAREGGDVVIEIADDGAGIDVDRVRAVHRLPDEFVAHRDPDHRRRTVQRVAVGHQLHVHARFHQPVDVGCRRRRDGVGRHRLDLLLQRFHDAVREVARAQRRCDGVLERHHGANVDGAFRIGHAHNAFEREMPAPLRADILGILPAHRLIEHLRKVVRRMGKIGIHLKNILVALV